MRTLIILCIILCIIVLFPVIDLAASETEMKASVDGNYYYSYPNRDSYLDPGNILGVDRNQFDLKSEATIKYKANSITFDLGFRYFYNSPFVFVEDRAYPDSKNLIFLDEAKVTFDVRENAKVTVGRQKFFWGPGFIKNPINVVNPPTDFRDSFYRLEEKSGVTSISGSLYSEKTTLTGVVLPNTFDEKYSQEYVLGKDQTRKSIVALKVDTVLTTIDLSFLLAKQEEETPKYGAAFSKIIDDVEMHGEALLQQGSRRQYVNQSSAPVIEEKYKDSSHFFGNYLIGLRYRSTSETDFLIEYYRNDSGYNNKERDDFVNVIKDYSFLGIGNMLFAEDSFRKDYLFLRVGLSDVLPRFSLELFTVFNMDDRSYLTGSGLKYRVSERMEAYTDIRTLHGSKESEFGMIPSYYILSAGIKISIF